MREVSEYKLLGYYLLKLYESAGINSIKYEQVKLLTDEICGKLNLTYNFVRMLPKKDILQKMISKGVFKTKSVNGKTTFCQIYNFEIAKNIYAVYDCDGYLTFKLPQGTGSEDKIAYAKKIYEADLNLDLRSCINSELKKFISKLNIKVKTFA